MLFFLLLWFLYSYSQLLSVLYFVSHCSLSVSFTKDCDDDDDDDDDDDVHDDEYFCFRVKT